MCRLLLHHGADPSRATEDGQTSIMRSAAEGHLEVLQLLASYGGDLDAETRDGETAYDIAHIASLATAGRSDDVINWLLSADDLTTLQIAVGCRDTSAIKYVLKNGHDDPARRIVTGLAIIAGFPAGISWLGLE